VSQNAGDEGAPLRRLPAGVLAWIVMALLSASAARGAPALIRVGYLGTSGDAGIFIAVDKGYFTEQGLTVETEVNAEAGHEWLEAAVTRVPDFFDAHP